MGVHDIPPLRVGGAKLGPGEIESVWGVSARGNDRLIVPYPGECRQASLMLGGAALSPPSCVGVIARNTVLRAIDRAREMPAVCVLPIPPADCRHVESMTLPRKKAACVISRLAQK